jgi:hypothetical protein
MSRSRAAAHLSGVAVDRRDTDEGSDTTAIELTKFGQIGDQSVCGDIADAGNRRFPGSTALRRTLQV